MRGKKNRPNVITFVLLAILIGISTYFLVQKSVLPSETYTEYRCEDVTDYKAAGYTFYRYDEHGCEIVQKLIYTGEVMSVRSYCACYLNCIGKNQDVECSEAFGSGWAGIGCGSGYTTLCQQMVADFKGGWTRIVNVCSYEENDLLAVETFQEGNINIYSTRYPIKGFCKAHPAIWMVENQSITSTTVYDDILSGKSITIPSGQTLTLFYVIENNYQLPTTCKGGEALNTQTLQCVSSTGIVYVCSVGQFDPALGLCVVQIDEPICSKGRLVKYSDTNYSCVWNPPLQAECDRGWYDVNENVCKYLPEIQFICSEGTLHQPSKSECLGSGYKWIDCPGCPEGQSCVDCPIPYCEEGQYCERKALKDVTVEIVNNVPVSVTHYYCENPNAVLKDDKCVIEISETKLTCADGRIPNADGECVTSAPAVVSYSCAGEWDSSHTTCLMPAPVRYKCGDRIVDDANECADPVVVYKDRVITQVRYVPAGGASVNKVLLWCLVASILIIVLIITLPKHKKKRRGADLL